MEISRHRRNLPNNTGGTSRPRVLTNFNLRRSQFVKAGKICLNQSLMYTHPFHPILPQFFICPCSCLYKKLEIFLGVGEHLPAPPPLRLRLCQQGFGGNNCHEAINCMCFALLIFLPNSSTLPALQCL
jgi:hypothetical protein